MTWRTVLVGSIPGKKSSRPHLSYGASGEVKTVCCLGWHLGYIPFSLCTCVCLTLVQSWKARLLLEVNWPPLPVLRSTFEYLVVITWCVTYWACLGKCRKTWHGVTQFLLEVVQVTLPCIKGYGLIVVKPITSRCRRGIRLCGVKYTANFLYCRRCLPPRVNRDKYLVEGSVIFGE